MSPRIKSLALSALLLLGSGSVSAYTLEEFKFDSPAQEAEFRDLIGKLRCLVCQNESLAGSQAGLAQDLRNEVYAMMRAGQPKDEILDFLVERYGDFVLYEPPLKPSTYLLWFGPFVFIGVGAFVVVRTLLGKKQAQDEPLSEAERERLQALMDPQRDAHSSDS